MRKIGTTNIAENQTVMSILSSISAVVAGLLFGLIILLFTDLNDALPAFNTILTGGFKLGTITLGKVLYYATPLILTGLSVGFAFKTGLFNIGASGQLIVGAYVAVYIGVKWTFLGEVQWIVALIFAGLAGALWGLIPGILKAYRNVHEVVATIMMNYIGLYLVDYLVKATVYNTSESRSSDVAENAIIPTFGLDKIFGPNSVNGGFFIAIIVVIIIYIILNKTTFGYQLKAVGHNKHASKYAGINEKKGIVMSMMIAGLLAGLAGGIMYLTSAYGKHLEIVDYLPAEGFNGIPVALLGVSNPLGILLAALFMGYIQVSGWVMTLYDIAPEIIDIIISAIIYFSALSIIFKELILKYLKKKNEGLLNRGDE